MIGGDQCPAQQFLGFYDLKGRNHRNLVLAFSGLQYDRPPTFEFFQTFENRNIDVIFIRDSEHLWYQGGTDGALGGFETIMNYLQPKIAGYEKVMTIGASMGGYAAMAAAVMLKGITSCIAFSPQTFIDKANRTRYGDARWPERMDFIASALPHSGYLDLRDLYRLHYKETPVFLFYGQNDKLDKTHAHYMKEFEGIRIIEVKDADHWAAHALKNYGIYDHIIDQAITSSIIIDTPLLNVIENRQRISLNIYNNKPMKMNTPREPGIWDVVAEEWPTTPQEYEIESAQQIEKLLKELKVPEGAKILEIAAGTGFPSSYLASRGYQTTVTDFSPNMIKKAKEYYEKTGLKGDFQVLDMFNASKETVGVHDVVFIQHVFDHYDGWEVLQVLEKMKDLGQYVIVLSQNPKCMPYLLFHRMMMGKGEWRWGLSVLRYGVRDLAELAGLEVIKETYFSATSLSKWMAKMVSPETGELYADSLDQNLIPEDQRHFRVLVGKARTNEMTIEEENRLLRSALKSELGALRNTYYLDTSALKKLATKLQDELKSKGIR